MKFFYTSLLSLSLLLTLLTFSADIPNNSSVPKKEEKAVEKKEEKQSSKLFSFFWREKTLRRTSPVYRYGHSAILYGGLAVLSPFTWPATIAGLVVLHGVKKVYENYEDINDGVSPTKSTIFPY